MHKLAIAFFESLSSGITMKIALLLVSKSSNSKSRPESNLAVAGSDIISDKEVVTIERYPLRVTSLSTLDTTLRY